MSYREQVWSISPDRSGEGFFIAAFEHESELFDLGREGRATKGLPIDLSGLLSRPGVTTSQWTRQRVPTDDARRVGAQLWFAVPPPIRESLQQHDPDKLVHHLKIATEADEVADLPWEWLFDGTEPPLALRPVVRLARTIPARLPVPSLTVQFPLRVLLLVPNPNDQRLLNTWQEIDTVMGRLRASEYETRVIDEPSLEVMASELTNWLPNVVHYIGHGGLMHGEGNLVLYDSGGRSHWVSPTELAGLLPASVRLLCLSTCVTAPNYQIHGLSHLGGVPGLVELPTTVANQLPVGQGTAGAFWQAFYAALLEEGGNVIEAVHRARVVTAAADPAFADWASFSLTMRNQTGVPFAIDRPRADPKRRRAAELNAQFAVQLANDLATQAEVLGDETPGGLRQQLETEQERAVGLLDELCRE